MRGGYQIVDLAGKGHSAGVGTVHEGIYDIIEGTEKPILLEGIVIDEVEYKPTYVSVTTNESNYEAVVYGYTMSITDTDVVTFTEIGG